MRFCDVAKVYASAVESGHSEITIRPASFNAGPERGEQSVRNQLVYGTIKRLVWRILQRRRSCHAARASDCCIAIAARAKGGFVPTAVIWKPQNCCVCDQGPLCGLRPQRFEKALNVRKGPVSLMASLQQFTSAHATVLNHFGQQRHLFNQPYFKETLDQPVAD